MCTEPKVQRRGSLRLITSRRAKSVIIKLKQWMTKRVKIVGDFEASLKTPMDESIESQNVSNENKLNIVRSKMAWTVEELRDIVDDNFANEVREMEAIAARE